MKAAEKEMKNLSDFARSLFVQWRDGGRDGDHLQWRSLIAGAVTSVAGFVLPVCVSCELKKCTSSWFSQGMNENLFQLVELSPQNSESGAAWLENTEVQVIVFQYELHWRKASWPFHVV